MKSIALVKYCGTGGHGCPPCNRFMRPLVIVCWLCTIAGMGSAQAPDADRPGAPGATAMAVAADSFLASLNEQQRAVALLPFDDPQRLRWHYVPQEKRKGIPFFDMNDTQRAAATALIRSSLSAEGFEKARLVMEQEAVIRYLENGNAIRDPLRYFVTVFDKPTTSGRWGLSIEGHHLSLNFVMDAGRIICATPMFIGANPATILDNGGVGPSTGTQMLKTEEGLVEKLAASLTPDQRKSAVVAAESPMDMREGNKTQTARVEPQGISAADLSAVQKADLLSFCRTVTGIVPPQASGETMRTTAMDVDKLRFAWHGPIEPGKPYSCRVESPKLLILLYKTQSDPAGNPANHTHVLWRTPGGDFGVTATQ